MGLEAIVAALSILAFFDRTTRGAVVDQLGDEPEAAGDHLEPAQDAPLGGVADAQAEVQISEAQATIPRRPVLIVPLVATLVPTLPPVSDLACGPGIGCPTHGNWTGACVRGFCDRGGSSGGQVVGSDAPTVPEPEPEAEAALLFPGGAPRQGGWWKPSADRPGENLSAAERRAKRLLAGAQGGYKSAEEWLLVALDEAYGTSFRTRSPLHYRPNEYAALDLVFSANARLLDASARPGMKWRYSSGDDARPGSWMADGWGVRDIWNGSPRSPGERDEPGDSYPVLYFPRIGESGGGGSRPNN